MLKSEKGSKTLDIVREYKTFLGNMKNADTEVKYNDGNLMEMEEQKLNTAEQFLSNNVLNCKEENNEADAEKTIYLERDIKIHFEELEDQKLFNVNESLLVVQDQKFEDNKCLIIEEIQIKTEQNEFDSLDGDDSSPQPKVGIQLRKRCGSLPGEYQRDSCLCQTKRKKDITSKYKIGMHRHASSNKNSSEITMYQCELCPFRAKHKGSLLYHELNHKDPSEVTMYQCVSCLYQTKRKQSLDRHLLTHKDPSEIEMYQCESCSFKTKYKQNLCMHMLKHKNPSETTMYQCEICPFKGKHKNGLIRHMLIHKDPSEVTMYQCPSCPYQTKRKQILDRHMLIHKDPSEIKMFQCASCPYQAKHKQSLDRHMSTHKDDSEIKIYQCKACPFTTKHKRSLHRHMLSHKNSSISLPTTMY